MQPYYKDPRGIVIYCGDAREILPKVKRNVIDLIVTDPPYGQNWQSNRRTLKMDKLQGDDVGAQALFERVMQASLPTLKRGRHVYIFGRFDLSQLPLTVSAELVWDKVIAGSGDLSSPWGPSHESIIFTRYQISKANRDAGDGRLAARLRQGSVLRYPRKNSIATRHPSEKPVAVLRQLIESSSMLGEIVLDPFGGVGSTAIAALAEERRAVIIELQENYCEIAANRLRTLQIPDWNAA